jgi:CRISPR-associated protein Csx17
MAFWEHDTFVLRSKFNRKELVEFFLNHYSPTPILSPWGGGSGFYFQEGKARDPVTGKLIKDPNGKYVKTGKRDQATTATKALKALEAATDPRFQAYREAISAARQLLDALGLKAAPKGAAKSKLLVALRNQLPDAAAQWLDCAVVLARRGSARPRGGSFLPSYAALLGSGGNDGNADFSVNFMQRLRDALISEANQASGRARQWLNAALFRLNAAGSRVMAFAGQYTPGTAGGPNAAAGFEGEYWVNPWDFILLLEGALFFTAAAVRRHGAGGNANAAFPFTVRATGAGYASASGADELDADDNFTEELWVPLWDRPTGRDELFAVLSEGRAQVGAAAASTGVDFARANCALDNGGTTSRSRRLL